MAGWGLEAHRRPEIGGKGLWLQSGTHGAIWHILWVSQEVEAGHSPNALTRMDLHSALWPPGLVPSCVKQGRGPKKLPCSKVFLEGTEDVP